MPTIAGVTNFVARRFVGNFLRAPSVHFVGFVSGIRTNADWVDQIQSSFDWVGEALDCRKITCEKGMSSSNLVFRHGLGSRRDQIRRQIQALLDESNGRKVSLVCHSMGCNIVASILEKDLSFRFECIIFMGNIVKKQYATMIKTKCEKFYNFRGVRDQWPLVATLVRFDCYGPTGTFGFSNALCRDFLFDCNHFECTDLQSVTNAVLPLLRGINPEISSFAFHYFNENLFRYALRINKTLIIACVLIFGAAFLSRGRILLATLFGLSLLFELAMFAFNASGRSRRGAETNI